MTPDDPLTDEEIRAKGYDPTGRGWVPLTPASENGSKVGSRSLRRTSWTAADLMEEEFAEPRFAVDGLIPEGLAFMCGAPKLGKSWMALGLGIAVASGGKALSAIDVEPGEVLYLALEDSPRRLQSRLRILLAGDIAPPGLHLETAWPRLDDGGAVKLEAWLDDHPAARLVIIDVWPKVRPRPSKGTDFYTADYEGVLSPQGPPEADLWSRRHADIRQRARQPTPAMPEPPGRSR